MKPIKRDAVDCLIVEAETIDSITWATKNSWEKKEGNTTWQHKHEAPIKTSTEKGLAKQKKPGQHTTHTLTRAVAGERKSTEDAWRAGETLSHAGFSWGQPQTLWICRQLFLPFFFFYFVFVLIRSVSDIYLFLFIPFYYLIVYPILFECLTTLWNFVNVCVCVAFFISVGNKKTANCFIVFCG